MAEGGELLVSVGMMDPPGWIKLMIDIEQFRKSEAGTEELPGDRFSSWLSEPDPRGKHNKVAASKPATKPTRAKSSPNPMPMDAAAAESEDDPEFTLPGEES